MSTPTLTSPKVSVVIPAYNGAKVIRDAISSALMQTHKPVEIIVVNDGSTDDTSNVLTEFSGQVKVIDQPNGGVAIARNQGIRHATGKYVAFLDQDDVWHPNKLETQIACINDDPNVGMVHTAVVYEDLSSKQTYDYADWKPDLDKYTGRCFLKMLSENGVCNSSVMVCRSVLLDVGMCDETITGNTVTDYDLWLKVAKKTNLAVVHEPVTVIRTHADQGSKNVTAMLEAEIKLLRSWLTKSSTTEIKLINQRLAKMHYRLGVARLDEGMHLRSGVSFLQGLRGGCRLQNTLGLAAAMCPRFFVNSVRKVARKMTGTKRTQHSHNSQSIYATKTN